jgi:hypothetical protein
VIDEQQGNLLFPGDVPVPVGETCGSCETPVKPGEWGQLVPHVEKRGVTIRPIHGECLVRDVMGGIEHLTAPKGHARGSCYEGSTLTRRESSIAAYAWIRDHGHGPFIPSEGEDA